MENLNPTNAFATSSFVSSLTLKTFLSLVSTLSLLVIALFYLFKFIVVGDEKENRPPLPPLLIKPWPFLGNVPEMLLNRPTFRWLHYLMEKINSDIACIRLGNVIVITVSSPEIAQEFLKKQDATFASRPVSMSTDVTTKGFLSTALVPFNDQYAKMKIIMVMDLLSPTRHRWLHGMRIDEADHLVRYVYNQCKMSSDQNGGLVDVRLTSQHYCSNLARKMLFNRRFFGEGKEDGGPGFEEEEHVNAVFGILAHIYSFCISDYLPFLRGFDIDGHEKVMDRILGIVEKYHDPLIEQRIQMRENEHNIEVKDLLDVMITSKDSKGRPLLTVDEIKAQITVRLSLSHAQGKNFSVNDDLF